MKSNAKTKSDQQIYADLANQESTMRAEANRSVCRLLFQLRQTYFDPKGLIPTTRNDLFYGGQFTYLALPSETLQQYVTTTLKEMKNFIEDTFNPKPVEEEKTSSPAPVVDQKLLVERRKDLKYIKELIEQHVNSLDVVEIFIPKDKEHPNEYVDQIQLFPLSETLVLVWKALHDDKQFAHTQVIPIGPETFTPEEIIQIQQNIPNAKIEKRLAALTELELKQLKRLTPQLIHEIQVERAKEDRVNRLKNFFLTALKPIRTNTVCHKGNRNELVFPLNLTYAGVNLIEHAKATVELFIKDYFKTEFWNLYATSPNKAELTDGLLQWAQGHGCNALYNLVDKSKIQKPLKELFKQNGINPEQEETSMAGNTKKVDQYIQDCLASLEFSVNPEEHPKLAKIAKVVYFLEDENHPERTAATLLIQNELLSSRDLSQVSDDAMGHFIQLYEADINFYKYRFIIDIHGQMTPEFQVLPVRLVDAFKQIKTLVDATTFVTPLKAIIKQYSDVVESVIVADRLNSDIQNFFNKWFGFKKEGNLKELNKLYLMLLDPEISKKILLTDSEIEKTTFKNTKDEAITISPYEINRVFLHALMMPTREWCSASI